MTRSKWVAVTAALLIALAALWYFAAPAWTLHRMQAAAKDGDGDALVAMIDFPALREDLKTELMARLVAEAGRDGSGAGALGVAFGATLLGPMIDGMVSPATIRAALLARPERGAARSEENTGRLPGLKLPEEPVIVRRGLSEFLVASQTDRASGLVFRRDGLGWKLAGIDLAPDPAVPLS